ncbi:MAG: RNA polymerase sigma factor [Bacteroidetes bacterium]|nr:MAG: RNA polymerase sigma factor [Bacteroidota bacterium]
MTRQEYNIVVQQLSNPLYGFSLKFLRNEEDAQDIVQDVFEKLWINRKKVEFLKAKAWMYTTAYNGMINLITKKQRVQLSGSDQLPEKSQKAFNHFESKEVVDRAVNILPPIQKSIILLRDLEGYSYDEIGEILDLSSSQVKVYLFRARNKIKKQLKGSTELV